MRKIRIGNDIAVQWSLVAKGTGEPFVVEGKDIRLSLKSIFATTEIEDFTARGNTIAWTFKGAEQKQTGIYSLVVSVVDAQGAMVTTDVCQFVELVACSCEADGADEAGVQTESIDLVSNVEIGGGGADIDLTDYLTKSDAEETYQPKENIYYFEWDSASGSGELDEATYQAIMAADKVCLKNGISITEPISKVSDGVECAYGFVADKYYVLFVFKSNYVIFPSPYYDDTKIKQELTELSAEVSGLSERIDNLPSGESSVFEAVYGETTYEEIVAARNEGKVVICNHQEQVFYLEYLNNTAAYFIAHYQTIFYVANCKASDNKWTYKAYNNNHSLENLENGNVKVTIANQSSEVATPQFVENLLGTIINGDY